MSRALLNRLLDWFGGVAGATPPPPKPGERDALGPLGERAAARHLKRSGYRVLGRNLRVPMGEADILCVAPDRSTIVLVEVKSRRVGAGAHGRFVPPPPEASVHAHKRQKLVAIIRHLANANGWGARPLRIDAVAVEFPARGLPVIRHHVGIVPGVR